MAHLQTASRKSQLKSLLSLAVQSILVFGAARGAQAQSANTLQQVKKVYVGSFGTDDAANRIRERMIQQIRKTKIVEVVQNPNEADGVLKGEASVWVTGYVSADPRSPANSRQAVYRGFLSAEVVGRDNETLWSYLVTPRKFRMGPIAEDLADQMVTELAGALKKGGEVTPVATVAERSGNVTLNVAGATFPAPLYEEWFESFQEIHPNVQVKYSAVGSDAGIRLLTSGKIDFAASDVPLALSEEGTANLKVLHFATVLGGVVPIYNLKGVDANLNFTAETLAGIYLGKIRKWDDPRIRESNRNARLPDSDIVVIHRADGSGTSFAWTDFLSKLSAEWKAAVGEGTMVKWPAGEGAEGNEGVAALVQKTPNAIGYVELVYALRHQLGYGAVRNAAGEFIQADLASVTAAAKGASGAINPDSRVSITNAAGKGAYPIATFTWWVLPADLGGSDKKPVIFDLLQWMLTSGQKECSALGYAPLPREIANRELQFLGTLK